MGYGYLCLSCQVMAKFAFRLSVVFLVKKTIVEADYEIPKRITTVTPDNVLSSYLIRVLELRFNLRSFRDGLKKRRTRRRTNLEKKDGKLEERIDKEFLALYNYA